MFSSIQQNKSTKEEKEEKPPSFNSSSFIRVICAMLDKCYKEKEDKFYYPYVSEFFKKYVTELNQNTQLEKENTFFVFLGILEVSSNKLIKGVDTLTTFIQQNINHELIFYAYYFRAIAYRKLNQKDNAKQDADKAESLIHTAPLLEKNDIDHFYHEACLWKNLSIGFNLTGNFTHAIETATKAIRCAEPYSFAGQYYLYRGGLYLQNDKRRYLKKALDDFQTIKNNGYNFQLENQELTGLIDIIIINLYHYIRPAFTSQDPNDIPWLLDAAHSIIDLDQQPEKHKKAVAFAHYCCARIYEKIRKNDPALTHVIQSIKKDPKLLDAYILKSQLYLNIHNNLPKAIQICEQGLKQNPDNPKLLKWLSYLKRVENLKTLLEDETKKPEEKKIAIKTIRKRKKQKRRNERKKSQKQEEKIQNEKKAISEKWRTEFKATYAILPEKTVALFAKLDKALKTEGLSLHLYGKTVLNFYILSEGLKVVTNNSENPALFIARDTDWLIPDVLPAKAYHITQLIQSDPFSFAFKNDLVNKINYQATHENKPHDLTLKYKVAEEKNKTLPMIPITDPDQVYLYFTETSDEKPYLTLMGKSILKTAFDTGEFIIYLHPSASFLLTREMKYTEDLAGVLKPKMISEKEIEITDDASRNAWFIQYFKTKINNGEYEKSIIADIDRMYKCGYLFLKTGNFSDKALPIISALFSVLLMQTNHYSDDRLYNMMLLIKTFYQTSIEKNTSFCSVMYCIRDMVQRETFSLKITPLDITPAVILLKNLIDVLPISKKDVQLFLTLQEDIYNQQIILAKQTAEIAQKHQALLMINQQYQVQAALLADQTKKVKAIFKAQKKLIKEKHQELLNMNELLTALIQDMGALQNKFLALNRGAQSTYTYGQQYQNAGHFRQPRETYPSESAPDPAPLNSARP